MEPKNERASEREREREKERERREMEKNAKREADTKRYSRLREARHARLAGAEDFVVS